MYCLLTRVAVRSGKTERWEAMNLVESQYEINTRSDIFRWRNKRNRTNHDTNFLILESDKHKKL